MATVPTIAPTPAPRSLSPAAVNIIRVVGYAALIALSIFGFGYAGGESAHQIVGELVKAVIPILVAGLGLGGYDVHQIAQVQGVPHSEALKLAFHKA